MWRWYRTVLKAFFMSLLSSSQATVYIIILLFLHTYCTNRTRRRRRRRRRRRINTSHIRPSYLLPFSPHAQTIAILPVLLHQPALLGLTLSSHCPSIHPIGGLPLGLTPLTSDLVIFFHSLHMPKPSQYSLKQCVERSECWQWTPFLCLVKGDSKGCSEGTGKPLLLLG